MSAVACTRCGGAARLIMTPYGLNLFKCTCCAAWLAQAAAA